MIFQCIAVVLLLLVSDTTSIRFIESTTDYDRKGQIAIDRPKGTKPGDLLVLFIHRSDDDLPVALNGWHRVASIFKKNNEVHGQRAEDCVRWHSGFKDEVCEKFKDGGDGHDLAQVAFIRTIRSNNEPDSYTLDLDLDVNGKRAPGWALMIAIRGADTSNPIQDWAFEGYDHDIGSIFPSVNGNRGDMLLLSLSFDEAIDASQFGPPDGLDLYDIQSESDEAGLVFGRVLSSSGSTGFMRTTGPAADRGDTYKDALLSLVIRAEGSGPLKESSSPSMCGWSGGHGDNVYACESDCDGGRCTTFSRGRRDCGLCPYSSNPPNPLNPPNTPETPDSPDAPDNESRMCGWSGSSLIFKHPCDGRCSNGRCETKHGNRKCGPCQATPNDRGMCGWSGSSLIFKHPCDGQCNNGRCETKHGNRKCGPCQTTSNAQESDTIIESDNVDDFEDSDSEEISPIFIGLIVLSCVIVVLVLTLLVLVLKK